MKVLVITGDKKFIPGNPRYDLQASVAERFEAVYFGRGAILPLLPEGPFDVVTSQDPFWRGLFALRAARKLGAKCNVQVHADLSGQSFVKRLLAKYVLRRADSVRAVTERIAQQVARRGTRAPVRVLPVFTDLAPFTALKKEPHQGKCILWVGRFEEEKNPREALRVLRTLQTRGVQASLVMLGSGSLEAKLREEAHGLPVSFPGWQHPAPFLARADLTLSTSLHESYGVSIIESLVAGVPVVAPDVGVAKEAGATVVPREKLVEAVAEALQSPKEGVLRLQLLEKKAWQEAFIQSLS